LVHFQAILYVSWHFGIFCGHLVYFPRFGILYHGKSGNPGNLIFETREARIPQNILNRVFQPFYPPALSQFMSRSHRAFLRRKPGVATLRFIRIQIRLCMQQNWVNLLSDSNAFIDSN
jgi:hypothetical protein